MNKLFYVIIFVFVSTFSVTAQRTLVDEWEANIGYLNFQGDYGTRGIFSTTLPNSGGMIGGKVYFNLLDSEQNQCYACQHLKFQLGFNTGYSILSFNGIKYSYPKLEAINGQIYFLNLAINAEYHLNNLRYIDYFSSSFANKFDPYLGLGVGIMAYGVDVDSALGNFEKDPSILPYEFVGGMYNKPGLVPSINLEVGIRYRVSDELQLSLNNKWFYFISDKVDGVVPNPKLTDNRYNDWMFSPSVGVVIFIW